MVKSLLFLVLACLSTGNMHVHSVHFQQEDKITQSTGNMNVHSVHFQQEDKISKVSVAVGDTLELSFFGLLSTGYNWVNLTTPRHLRPDAFLRQEVPPNKWVVLLRSCAILPICASYIQYCATYISTPLHIFCSFVWNFTAVRAGQERLDFICKKPWEAQAADTVNLTVSVTSEDNPVK